MLFHVSIDAADPRRTAQAFAALTRGRALPFPPVGVGSWLAFTGDDDGTLIEVYPAGTRLVEAAGDEDSYGVVGARAAGSPTHFALGTPFEVDEALAMIGAAGWTGKVCRRGGKFRVIECWIDGRQMIELLTPSMQAEYRAAVTIGGWEAMLAEGMAKAA